MKRTAIGTTLAASMLLMLIKPAFASEAVPCNELSALGYAQPKDADLQAAAKAARSILEHIQQRDLTSLWMMVEDELDEGPRKALINCSP